MFRICLLSLSILLPNSGLCYSLSFMAEQKVFPRFDEYLYTYSLLFRQGRDNFHWLDLSYGDNSYLLRTEIGRSNILASSYRFSQRQRWARYFKPSIFVGTGLYKRNLSQRRMIIENNTLAGRIGDKQFLGYNFYTGVGYVWEIRALLLGISLSYGYDFSYQQRFYGRSIFFSYDI